MIDFITNWMPEIAVGFFYVIFGFKIFMRAREQA